MRTRVEYAYGILFSLGIIMFSMLCFFLFVINATIFKASVLGIEQGKANLILFFVGILSFIFGFFSFILNLIIFKKRWK